MSPNPNPAPTPTDGLPRCGTCPYFTPDAPIMTLGEGAIARGNGKCHLDPRVEPVQAQHWCSHHPARSAGAFVAVCDGSVTVPMAPRIAPTPTARAKT